MIRRASRDLQRMSPRCIHGVASEGFAADASLYDRVRPSYPALGVAHALGDVDAAWARILDVASGTGILTRRLLEFGARDVAAVEPVAAMRAEFERRRAPVPQGPLARGLRDARARAFPGGCERVLRQLLLTTRAEIWERALSKSYCATLPPDQRNALVAEIAAIVDHYEASGALAFDVARPGDGAPCARLPINSEVAVAVRGARA
ncbi:trans-aconitate 3-methyltransferase [Aureococcus anophagefferens]|nr:trans-aconitate 3-methyltransferase [Aureococcus anophagefferens]